MEEIEIKYRCDSSHSELFNVLKKMKFRKSGTQEQTDEYWDTKDFDIINLKRGLRIRYINDKIHSVQFKSLFRKKDGSYFVEEIDLLNNGILNVRLLKEIVIDRLGLDCIVKDNVSEMTPRELLTLMGLKMAIRFCKKREIFEGKESKFHLCVDEVRGFPIYIEIEADSKEILSVVCSKIEKLLKLEKTGQKGYLGILFNNTRGIIKEEDFQKKFNENFKWNVRPSEFEIYERINNS